MSDYDGGVHQKKERFLEAFAKCGVIMLAAEAAGCARQAHYNWLKEDPEYPARFAEAREAAADRIDAEILRRGVTGYDEPVFGTIYDSKGRPIRKDVVGTIRRYSDTLLIFRAKLVRPEYREHMTIEHEGNLIKSVQIVMPQAENKETGGNGKKNGDE